MFVYQSLRARIARLGKGNYGNVKVRSILSVVALSVSIGGASAVLFDVADINSLAKDPTIAMVPISLGNPAAAATLSPRSTKARTVEPSSAPRVIVEEPIAVEPIPFEKTLTLKSGNTLSGLLISAGIERIEAAEIVESFSETFDPRKIRAGQDIVLQFLSSEDNGDLFVGLRYEPTKLDVVSLKRTDNGFSAETAQKALTTEVRHATGRIDSSLYAAGMAAGMPVPILIELIRAYSWDVDFQRSIRKGDGFSVMYEVRHDDKGTVVAYGDILYAELELSGDKLPVFRYTTSTGITGYFDDQGQSAKKALMRTPIDGARLSSSYGMRKHPILGYNKMHRGVDFAAPSGTPIYAAGDGAVLFAGWKGVYGKFIRIRHDREFDTAYAHLKSFAKGMKSGKRVRQGQVIGYVGTTGRSTGPHLHYEVLKNNTQVNPMKVKMPAGEKLTGAELDTFKKVAEGLFDQYAVVSGQSVAANDLPQASAEN